MKKPIVAILYDFDSTLAKSDMQNFGFIPSLGMTPAEFWEETTSFCNKTGIERTLGYLFMMIAKSKEKNIPLTYDYLRSQGAPIEFWPGVIDWFQRINEYGESLGLKIEHYLVSSGNKEIVDGCQIAKEFKVIYGCEFYFDKTTKEAIWPKLVINFTQKTQYFYRISKGAFDINDDAGVNEKVPSRRIKHSNMIYIGDGMTDIPAMIVAKESGGKSIAVYPRGKEDKVKALFDDGRVNYVCPADYRPGKDLDKIMGLILQGIAIKESLASRDSEGAGN